MYTKNSITINKKTLVLLSSLFLILTGGLITYATPPATPYTVGETLDPICNPGDPFCFVDIPTGLLTANNGLTSSGTNVQLGGTLVKDTDIIQGTNTLTSTFTGATGTYTFLNGNYGPIQGTGMLYTPTATPHIVTAAVVTNTGAVLATKDYATTEGSNISTWVDPGTGEHRAVLGTRANDAAKDYSITSFAQSGTIIMSEYDKTLDFTGKDISINSDEIRQSLNYSRTDNQNYLYNEMKMDDTSLHFSIGNSVVAGVFSGSGKEYQLSNTGHEFKGLDLFANQYSSTRDDSGIFAPVNFLYTDSSGKMLSSPLSSITGNMWSLAGNPGTTPGTHFIGTTDAKDLIFKTSNTEAMRIASDGRIAIGTAPALGKILTIAGDVKITGVLDPTKLVFSDGSPSSFDPSTNNRYEIDYGSRDLLFTSSGSSNPLFLSNTGNVGIGVNSGLLATLDVRGTGLLRTASNSTTGFQVQNALTNSVFDVDTVNRRVGINTASPATDFSLLGVSTTSGTESGRMLITGQAPNGYGGLTAKQCLGTCATEIESTFSVGTSGIPYAYMGTTSNHRAVIQTNFVQRMVFDTTGNVGVGVAVNATIPDKFQVLGDIRTGTATTNGCIKNFAGTGIVGTCSSDERLKTNIIDITGALDKIKSLRPVTYQWNTVAHDLYNNNTDVTNRGFLAQNIESIYPELVITDSNGYKQVDYSGMSIYTAAAVKELAIKLDAIEKVSTETLLQGSLRQWFADATNGITDFFAGRVRTNELCIGSTCLNESQIQQILQYTNTNINTNTQIETVSTPTPVISDNTTETTPTIPDGSDTAPVIENIETPTM